jgi:hypothetical protein
MTTQDDSESVELRAYWNDLGDPTKAGDYRFKEGIITLTEDQIGLWVAMPAGYFVVAKTSNSTAGQVRYLAGEFFAPTT